MKKIIFVIAVSLMFILPTAISACTPRQADPWYKTKLTFDTNTFPPGLEVVNTDPQYEPYAFFYKGPDPLYFLDSISDSTASTSETELPVGLYPKYKLINGNVFYFGTLNSQDTPYWMPNSGGINNSGEKQISVYKVMTLEEESKNIYRDNRPNDVQIPAPQNFTVPIYYKNNSLQIKGTVEYSINEDYDPKAREKGVNDCSQFDTMVILFNSIPPIFLLVVTVFLVNTVTKKIRSRYFNK